MQRIKLIRGDCLEKMKSIPDSSIDFCLTDPPYGITACKWDSVIPFEPMWEQLKRIVKDNGAIALFGSEPFSSNLRMSNLKMYKYDWVWHKSRSSGIAQSKYMPMKSHEIISVFAISKTVFYPIREKRVGKSENRKPWATCNSGDSSHGLNKTHKKIIDELRNPTTVKFFKSTSNYPSSFHPTQKPVALLEYLIKTYTLENETVLDFTAGSFSTGVACVNLNRGFIGIEKDEGYFNIGVKRIKERIKCLDLKIEPMRDMEDL
jgi:site-specific DNA-methyltransferase (adenine-specific)